MNLVEKILSILPLLCGVCAFVSGVVMIWHLPSNKRKVEAGEIKRSPFRPSFQDIVDCCYWRRGCRDSVFYFLVLV